MAIIQLETYIEAPIDRVFDLARSIDLHKISTKETREEAIAGKTSGLIGPGESVTWRAKHFGISQELSAIVTEFDRPTLFADKMVKGAFASMQHRHCFETHGEGTLMKDTFEFKAPLGILGRMVELMFLKSYMKRFLERRNAELKATAESDRWKEILS